MFVLNEMGKTMKEKEISTEESIEIINQMISLSREKLSQSGFHFILWGILVALASVFQYLINEYQIFELSSNGIWPIVPLIGVPTAFFYELRRNKKSVAQGKFDRLYNFVWLGFGITLILIITFSVASKTNPIPYILSITGLAVLISSIIYDFLPLKIGAVVFWLAALLTLFVSDNQQLLLNAAALVLGYIIPGILFSRKNVSAA